MVFPAQELATILVVTYFVGNSLGKELGSWNDVWFLLLDSYSPWAVIWP